MTQLGGMHFGSLSRGTLLVALLLLIATSFCRSIVAEEKPDGPGKKDAHEKAESRQRNDSATEKYRLVWISNPATEAVFGWNQIAGEPATLYYGPEDFGRKAEEYPEHVACERVVAYDGMTNCFARMSGLKPATRYYLCLEDDSGVSRRFQFVTAPAEPGRFTFIAGGDSRNFRDVRIVANKLCAKLKPLFVAFTGDMINQDVDTEWVEWLDDWQHTTGEDGQLIPIVAHRGNHERRPETIPYYFNTPDDSYYAFSVGGTLCRYLALNSEIPAIGEQEEWLDEELSASATTHTHLIAGYHKPMRPHVSAKSEGTNPMNWADNFYRFGVDLVLESDSHVMKRTLPLKPDPNGAEGFSSSENDPFATVYIGEGCWGAPLRAADDAKPWTLDCASFNGFDWLEVSPEGIRIKTVKLENESKVRPVAEWNSFDTPEGLQLWAAKGGEVLRIPADRGE